MVQMRGFDSFETVSKVKRGEGGKKGKKRGAIREKSKEASYINQFKYSRVGIVVV